MRTARVFYSYSSKDEELRKELETHLSVLRRTAVIATWSFRCIPAGERWEPAVDEALEAADIVLLLVSAHFLASDYCWEIEMKRALERQAAGSAVVVPIILRHCGWRHTDLKDLQALPVGDRVVMSWKHREKVWTDIVNELEQIARRFTSRHDVPTHPYIPQAPLVTALGTAASTTGASELLGITEDELQRHMTAHSLSLDTARSEFNEERRRLVDALNIGGSFKDACDILDMSREELFDRLRVHQLSLISARAEAMPA